MTIKHERLVEILCDEMEKEKGLPPGAMDHIQKLREFGARVGSGLAAAIRAMEIAVRESGGEIS
jgi:hypothetical protein